MIDLNQPRQRPPKRDLTTLVICVILSVVTSVTVVKLLRHIGKLGVGHEQQKREPTEQQFFVPSESL